MLNQTVEKTAWSTLMMTIGFSSLNLAVKMACGLLIHIIFIVDFVESCCRLSALNYVIIAWLSHRTVLVMDRKLALDLLTSSLDTLHVDYVMLGLVWTAFVDQLGSFLTRMPCRMIKA